MIRDEEVLSLAIKFHDAYERLAPQYGYETRRETRKFDAQSPNGRLMIAVCREVMDEDASAAPKLLARVRELEAERERLRGAIIRLCAAIEAEDGYDPFDTTDSRTTLRNRTYKAMREAKAATGINYRANAGEAGE